MGKTPTFKNPPIVEFVLGTQFSPLTNISSGHFGLFWKELGEDTWLPGDGPPIDDQFELFDRPKWSHRAGMQMRVETAYPVGRFVLTHRDQDRLIQVQPTRFHFNWRKTEGFKPGYKLLIAEFEEMFNRFQAFARSANLGELALNQWELTYVDSFPQQDYWETPGDWSKFLPGLFGNLFSMPGPQVNLEHRAAEWSFEIVPKRGRLHIAANSGQWRDSRDSLLLTTTARGPIGKHGVATLKEGLDLGHKVAVQSFLNVTSDEVKQRWGEQS